MYPSSESIDEITKDESKNKKLNGEILARNYNGRSVRLVECMLGLIAPMR